MKTLHPLQDPDLVIIQAPMAGVTTVELAAAVCEAGGIGSLGLGHLTTSQAKQQIQALQKRTDQPFNVNFFAHAPVSPYPAAEKKWLELLQPYFDEAQTQPPSKLSAPYQSAVDNKELIQMLCEVKPPIVSFHFGIPALEDILALKQAGIYVWGCATSAPEALLLRDKGVDAIIAQGFEAGGHRGTFHPKHDHQYSLAVLLSLLRPLVNLPLIAAGGIMNGNGIKAALALGADAVQMGTAFILCPESSADSSYRQHLQSERSLNTEITAVISGRPARGLKNRMHTEVAEFSDFLPDYPIAYAAAKALHAAASKRGSVDFAAHWAGQGAPLARTLPAAELIRLLKYEAQN